MRFTTRMELPRTLNRTQTSHSIPQSLCVIIITQYNRGRTEKEEKQEWKEGHEGGNGMGKGFVEREEGRKEWDGNESLTQRQNRIEMNE